MEREIKITNDLKEVETLANFVEALCDELALSPETTMNINLALEEAVVNVIMYAYPQEWQSDILLKVSSTDNQLIFLLTDTGASFDPTKAPDVNLTLTIEERPVGGLGIFLVRSIMNEVTYQRLDGENRLTMKKDIK